MNCTLCEIVCTFFQGDDDNEEDDDEFDIFKKPMDPRNICDRCKVSEADFVCDECKGRAKKMCNDCWKDVHFHISKADHHKRNFFPFIPGEKENPHEKELSSESEITETASNVENDGIESAAPSHDPSEAPEILPENDLDAPSTSQITSNPNSQLSNTQTNSSTSAPIPTPSVTNSNIGTNMSPGAGEPNPESLSQALTSTLNAFYRANLEKMQSTLTKACEPSSSKKKSNDNVPAAFDQYMIERKGLDLLQEMEIHNKRKELLDLELQEQRESAKKRLRILEAEAKEKENRREISEINLRKAKQQESAVLCGNCSQNIGSASVDTPNDTQPFGQSRFFIFNTPTTTPPNQQPLILETQAPQAGVSTDTQG